MTALLAFLYCVSSALAAPASSWIPDALLLSSEEPDARSRATRRLEALSDLDARLTAALSTDERDGALLVIRVLRRKGTLPGLLEAISRDDDWRLLATASTLLEPSNQDRIHAAFRQALDRPGTRAAPRMALLQGLASAPDALPTDTLRQLLAHESHEVRVAAARYAGTRLLEKKEAAFAPLLHEAFSLKPYQLRLEALEWARQARAANIDGFDEMLRSCRQDPAPEVRERCP